MLKKQLLIIFIALNISLIRWIIPVLGKKPSNLTNIHQDAESLWAFSKKVDKKHLKISELLLIPGISDKTAKALFHHTIDCQTKDLTSELSKIKGIGSKKANLLLHYISICEANAPLR